MTIRDYISQSELSGGITDYCQAVAMLNATRQLLYPLDDWVGTVSYGCVRASDCCFYLPAHIETARLAWQCTQSIPINNENWYYVDANNLSQFCGDSIAVVRTDRSAVLPVAFPENCQIGFAIQDQEDSGVEISVTAVNVFGSVVTEKITLTSINECEFAELSIKELLGINKPTTVGSIRVMVRGQCDIRNIYTLESFETQIKYWQYRALNVCDCLVIKGKKKFVPYRDNDLDREVDITNFTALQFASQAIEHQRNKRYEEHTNAMRLARAYLERTKEDLRKTNSPGVPASWEPRVPVSNTVYGYR